MYYLQDTLTRLVPHSNTTSKNDARYTIWQEGGIIVCLQRDPVTKTVPNPIQAP